MTLLNPSHPGEIIKEEVIEYLGLSIEEAAEGLGVSPVMLSRVVKCEEGVNTDLAFRLELAGVSTARSWLALQANYDLVQLKKHPAPHVRTLSEPVAA